MSEEQIFFVGGVANSPTRARCPLCGFLTKVRADNTIAVHRIGTTWKDSWRCSGAGSWVDQRIELPRR
jgi:hypothetical protein